MAREARKISENGLYHVYFKACANEKIFKRSEDYGKFLSLAEKLSDRHEIFAYGFNDSDGHLLIKTFALSAVMKKLVTDYAMWFNRKYSRSGTLFGSRYKSEPIADEFAAGAARYIIQHSKINSAERYKNGDVPAILVDGFDSAADFLNYLKMPEPETYGADSPRNSAAVKAEFNSVMNGKTFYALSNEERAEVIFRLMEFGLTKSAIARLADVSRGTVVRCLKIEDNNKKAELRRRNAEVVLL